MVTKKTDDAFVGPPEPVVHVHHLIAEVGSAPPGAGMPEVQVRCTEPGCTYVVTERATGRTPHNG